MIPTFKRLWSAEALLISAWLCAGLLNLPAQNLVVNPSAEDFDAAGRPKGWGQYGGCGKALLITSSSEKHTGLRSACLQMTDWWPAQTNASLQQANNAIVFCQNDGYSASGAISCAPDTEYAFMFWYKGDFQSAFAEATCWPSASAGPTERTTCLRTVLNAATDWQRLSGTFRTPTNATVLAMMVRLTAARSAGEKLGTVYVDDVHILKKVLPDNELRGVWWYLKATDKVTGLKEMNDSFSQIRAAGLNTVFVWVDSLYLAALERPELVTDAPQAGWDSLAEILNVANSNALQAHAWFSPWINKEKSQAVELRDHPEWCTTDAAGVTNPPGVCFFRPEVRQFELSLLAKLMDRYPGLAGIHLEEPGFPWGDYCYCQYCLQLTRDWYGLDIRTNLGTFTAVQANLAASMSSDFVVRLRQLLATNWPWAWLSVNGSGGDGAKELRLGRAWPIWASRKYIDFYVPQLYTTNSETFQSLARETQRNLLGNCALVSGVGVRWSGLAPVPSQSSETLKGQILASKRLGAMGFVLFRSDYLNAGVLASVAEVSQVAPTRGLAAPTELRAVANPSSSNGP